MERNESQGAPLSRGIRQKGAHGTTGEWVGRQTQVTSESGRGRGL